MSTVAVGAVATGTGSILSFVADQKLPLCRTACSACHLGNAVPENTVINMPLVGLYSEAFQKAGADAVERRGAKARLAMVAQARLASAA